MVRPLFFIFPFSGTMLINENYLHNQSFEQIQVYAYLCIHPLTCDLLMPPQMKEAAFL